MSNILTTKEDMKVQLIGYMNRESFADIAATITRSEKSIEEIVQMDYNADLAKRVMEYSHAAITQFDYFVFAVSGASRICEIQLVRKKVGASYMIKSGRNELKGKRKYEIVLPKKVQDHYASIKIDSSKILVDGYTNLEDLIGRGHSLEIDLFARNLVDMTEQWYESGVRCGLPEEDLRYMKQQGTAWQGLIAMTGNALLDWFKIRCCNNAQDEIQWLARQMCNLCKEKAPVLFEKAGPSCVSLGYCPENEMQNKKCKGSVITHKAVLAMIDKHKGQYL